MHGRKKTDLQNRTEAEKEALQKKVLNYQQLARLALARRAAGATGDVPSSLQLSGQLLRVNPDVYTLWNHRKEILQATGALTADQLRTEAGVASLTKELELAAECILKNPKSYGAWHHRRWIFERAMAALGEGQPDADLATKGKLVELLDEELSLCKRFLDADERNFHCWSYRRFVADIHPHRTAQQEFDFSTECIHRNFSNYSAFHHRTAYLPQVIQALRQAQRNPNSLTAEHELLRSELEMVQQAFFTEPDDQTAWWYHQYLVAWAARLDQDVYRKTLEGEIEGVRGLLEDAEGDRPYRWAVLTLADLLRKLGDVLKGDGTDRCSVIEESRRLYEQLTQDDPAHCERYRALLRKLRATAD